MSAESPKAQGSTGADRWGRVRRGLLMLMLMLVSSLPATTLLARPVQAQTPVVVPDENWTEMGLVGAMYELLLLIELDAFESTPAIDRMRDEVGFDHMTRDELIEELILVDDDNDLLLSLLPDREWEWISDEVDLTLGVIPDPLFSLIENGQRNFLDPGQWLDAIADLARRRGGPPLPMRDRDRVLVMDVLLSLDSDGEIDLGMWTEPRVLQLEAEQTAPPTTSPPTTITPATVASTAAPTTIVEQRVTSTTAAVAAAPAGLPAADGQPASGEGGSALPLALGGGAVLLVLALAGAMAFRRRGGERPTGPTPTAADVGAMLDISRRMTSALDADQVRSIAVDESNRLTGADAAAYIAKTEGGAEVAVASASGVFSPSLIRGGVVGRVLEAGQKVIEVVAADPLLGSGGGAVASVAVIANGGVEGA
ncbi:MAG: hypothetical protein KDB16_11750, partial [Acidimicrobiales bacterium]|nr:hypothetical protein [Acidimicrobiales bacterium]